MLFSILKSFFASSNSLWLKMLSKMVKSEHVVERWLRLQGNTAIKTSQMDRMQSSSSHVFVCLLFVFLFFGGDFFFFFFFGGGCLFVCLFCFLGGDSFVYKHCSVALTGSWLLASPWWVVSLTKSSHQGDGRYVCTESTTYAGWCPYINSHWLSLIRCLQIINATKQRTPPPPPPPPPPPLA